MIKQIRTVFAIASLCTAFAPCTLFASSITYTASGSGNDGPLSATASFTTSPGSLTLVLTDTTSASTIRSAGQALSDISFTLSSPAGTMGTATSSGQLANVSGSGGVTYTSGSPTRWVGVGGGTYTVSGSSVYLSAIGGGKPADMIGPSISNGGTYSNANNGFQQFDPYVVGPDTITLALSGISSSTTISGVMFSFGTGPDTNVPGVPSASTPEPESLCLALTGIASLGLVQLRRFLPGSNA